MKQPPRIARLTGTSWTSVALKDGWRHFHVVGVSRTDAGWAVELAASCDSLRRVTVPARELFDRESWQAGWVSVAHRCAALKGYPVMGSGATGASGAAFLVTVREPSAGTCASTSRR